MHEDWVPPYLPPEVVVIMISSLDRQRDVETCKYVCKMWNKHTKGISAPWVGVAAIPLYLASKLMGYPPAPFYNKPSFDIDHVVKYVSTVKPLDVNLVVQKNTTIGGNKIPMNLFELKDNVTGGVIDYTVPPKYNPAHSYVIPIPSGITGNPDHHFFEHICELMLTCQKHPYMWRFSVYPLVQERFNFEFTPIPSYIFLAEVNYSEVENWAKRTEDDVLVARYHDPRYVMIDGVVKHKIPMMDQILSFAGKKHTKFIDKLYAFDRSAAKIPLKTIIPQQQPIGLRKNIQLYKYQLDAVAWMKSIEDNAKIGYQSTGKLVPFYNTKCSAMIDYDKRYIISEEEVKKKNFYAFPQRWFFGG